MDIKEFISSGILELYVLGQLSEDERKTVEDMAQKHMEVKRELYEIELALEKYANAQSIQAPDKVKNSIFKELKPNSTSTDLKPVRGKVNPLAYVLLLCLALLTAFYFWKQNQQYKELKSLYDQQKLYCDSIQEAQNGKMLFVNDLKQPENEVVRIAATPKFSSTVIFLHSNKTKQFNYLQLNNLPTLSEGQVFQLWSLQEGKDPVPMETFTSQDAFVKVGYYDQTVNYAITIEKTGGSKTPDLSNLLGTFKV